ncbi:MAG: hypothetical protein JNJ58_02980 [Chitinophagaceae bacterium]|nr:hypothetical protein [Chitinophagaceae bacterium]
MEEQIKIDLDGVRSQETPGLLRVADFIGKVFGMGGKLRSKDTVKYYICFFFILFLLSCSSIRLSTKSFYIIRPTLNISSEIQMDIIISSGKYDKNKSHLFVVGKVYIESSNEILGDVTITQGKIGGRSDLGKTDNLGNFKINIPFSNSDTLFFGKLPFKSIGLILKSNF